MQIKPLCLLLCFTQAYLIFTVEIVMQINNKEKGAYLEKGTYLELASVVAEKSYSRDLMSYYRLEPRIIKVFLQKYSEKLQKVMSYSSMHEPQIRYQESIDFLFESFGLSRGYTIKKEENIFLNGVKSEQFITDVQFSYKSPEFWHVSGYSYRTKHWFVKPEEMLKRLKLHNKVADYSFLRDRIAFMRTQKIFDLSGRIRAINNVLLKKQRPLPDEIKLKIFDFLPLQDVYSDCVHLVEYALEKEGTLADNSYRDIYEKILHEETNRKNKKYNTALTSCCTIF